MKHFIWKVISAAALAATLSIVPALAQTNAHSPHHAVTTDSEELSTLQGEAFDIAFMQQMIEHHRGAVIMSEELLLDHPDAESRYAAEAILAAQGPEIDQMTEWLAEWYGVKYVAGTMTGTHGMSTTDTTTTNPSDPDAVFLREMVAHHLSAIDMSSLALVRATRTELRALARDIIVAQSHEIFEFQEWLAAR